MLTSPTPVPGKATSCRATPVKLVFLAVPGIIVALVVGYFIGPVPWRWVQDILKAADLALRKDWEEVMDDVESVRAVEETVALF